VFASDRIILSSNVFRSTCVSNRQPPSSTALAQLCSSGLLSQLFTRMSSVMAPDLIHHAQGRVSSPQPLHPWLHRYLLPPPCNPPSSHRRMDRATISACLFLNLLDIAPSAASWNRWTLAMAFSRAIKSISVPLGVISRDFTAIWDPPSHSPLWPLGQPPNSGLVKIGPSTYFRRLSRHPEHNRALPTWAPIYQGSLRNNRGVQPLTAGGIQIISPVLAQR